MEGKIESFDEYFHAANEVEYHNRLFNFARESNRIEGITSEQENQRMFQKLDAFLKLKKLTVDNVCEFNEWGRLRDRIGMNVRVGGRVCPSGGDYIKNELSLIISRANNGSSIFREPFCIHKAFEELHPFMDGNGRTVRAIWLWQMVNQQGYDLRRGILHEFYYQSLSN